MSERNRKTSFEDHLSVVTQQHTKTASARNGQGQEMLARLAQELGMTKSASEGEFAPTAEGERTPAEARRGMANPAVVAATEAVAVPQPMLAGMSNEEQMAGEEVAGLSVDFPTIGSGTGDDQTAIGLNRTDESTAAAADVEAEKVGRLMAHSFNDELNNMAAYQDFSQSVEILKEAGLLDEYALIDEGMEKSASASDGYLEKIATGQILSYEDVVGAANELVELQKSAEFAAAEGRDEARALVKLAEDMAGQSEEKDDDDKDDDDRDDDDKDEDGNEKVAALLQNPQIVSAVKVLKQYHLL